MPKKFAFIACTIIALFNFPISSTAGEAISVKQSVINTLKISPRLAMMKHNQEAVGFDRKKAQGNYYPQVDVRARYGVGSHSNPVTRRESRDNHWGDRGEASITLMQLLYDGGETKSQVGIDTYRVESIDHRVFDNAEALALDAALTALEVYRQKKLLAIAKNNIETHNAILSFLEESEEAGAGSVADVTQTRARLSRTTATLYSVVSDLDKALSNFKRLTGITPFDVKFPESPEKALPLTLDELLKMVLANNPKYLAANSDSKTAEENVFLERSKYYPKFFLEAGINYDHGIDGLDSWTRDDAVMVRANWNIFNGISDLMAEKAARARKLQADMSRRDLGKAIVDETTVTWTLYKSAIEEEKAYSENVRFSRETTHLYNDQFTVAQRSLLDLLDAENEYFQSEGLYTSAKVNRVAAAYKLFALAGKLLETLEIDPAIYR